MAHIREKKQSLEIVPEEAQMSDFILYKDFQSAITSMFKELRETMSRELKRRIMSHQIENIREKIEIIIVLRGRA